LYFTPQRLLTLFNYVANRIVWVHKVRKPR